MQLAKLHRAQEGEGAGLVHVVVVAVPTVHCRIPVLFGIALPDALLDPSYSSFALLDVYETCAGLGTTRVTFMRKRQAAGTRGAPVIRETGKARLVESSGAGALGQIPPPRVRAQGPTGPWRSGGTWGPDGLLGPWGQWAHGAIGL